MHVSSMHVLSMQVSSIHVSRFRVYIFHILITYECTSIHYSHESRFLQRGRMCSPASLLHTQSRFLQRAVSADSALLPLPPESHVGKKQMTVKSVKSDKVMDNLDTVMSQINGITFVVLWRRRRRRRRSCEGAWFVFN